MVFGVLGAASNATGTAFQREAASTLKQGGGLHFLLMLMRRPAWTIGVLGVMGAALFQALALLNGPIALVQPLFVLELPFALMIVGRLLHRSIPAEGWYGVGAVVAGLGVLLASAAPHGGGAQAPLSRWIPALVVCYGLMGAAVVVARTRCSPQLRAVALGAAAAVGNATTAALLKSATTTFSDHGIGAFLSAWQTYGFAITGIAAVLLLENALQAGPLAASQPALTIGDALVSLVLGVTVFQETVRTGWWLVPEILGLALMCAGVLLLTRAIPAIRSADGRPA
ncbi:DMT family transporter [Actinacidiphila acidipaludis]|uniref:DMT family transporter n=1 Tax=Actinacidiphila acidipaludis TaxID=2873382 RepID=A0ABS7QD00_9ACTN|nr:DMT family transporter [Streptomyces acidipaludis]MBY8880848.1 DMT family transporter [Streptomyces acidipaludis]